MTTTDQKKGALKRYLDSVLGDDGVKTDLKITITNESLVKISGTLIGSGLAITLIVFAIKNIWGDK